MRRFRAMSTLLSGSQGVTAGGTQTCRADKTLANNRSARHRLGALFGQQLALQFKSVLSGRNQVNIAKLLPMPLQLVPLERLVM